MASDTVVRTSDEKRDQVLRDIEAVLKRRGASLFFTAPARLWVNGEDLGEIWHEDSGDGSRLEPVGAAEAEES